MDSIIPLGQKNTLAEYMILSGADNRPPMLDKDLYDSWKSRMELYMQNREHGRMILESVENGPLIWPTVEENGVTRTKKYAELSAAEKIQADCDMKATNIILQGLPADIYSLVNHHRVAKDLWERVQLLMQGFTVPIFFPGDDPIACLNKAMAFLIAVASSSGDKVKVIMVLGIRVILLVLGETIQVDSQGLLNVTTIKIRGVPDGQVVQTIIPNNAAFQTEDLDAYDSDYDDISNTEAILMANISNYGSNVISEVPHSETYLNDMENQSVHAIQDFEQTPAMDFTANEIHSDSNIILYSQYLQETQQENVQDTHLQAQQDSMILSVIEQMSEQMINHVNNWENANKEQNSESVTAELERYKERVKTLEQRLNIDLSSREKMIDSQMDDMIKKKLALKEQVDSLEQNLSKQIKEKECLKQTFTVFKTMHVIDDEETLILEEKSRSKMSEKAKDPEVINKNISHKPIDYEKVNRLSEDFGKRFTPQQEMDAEQAFWFDNVVKIRTTPDARTEEFFEKNDLKAQLQDKDSTICKFKDMIKSMREKSKEENVECNYGEIKTKNVELENSVAKFISENERLCNDINHVKQVFKEQFDSIKKTCVHTKEHSDSLIDKLNLKSAENEDLKAQIQDKVFVITSLKKNLQKMIEKKLLILLHKYHLPALLFQAFEQAKAKQPLDKVLDFTYKHAQRIQELLVYVQDTCPNVINLSAKKVVVTPKNKVKKVRIEVFYYTLTIVGNLCPLTRITSANVVPPKKTTSHSVETQKPELKVYSRKPKNVKNTGSSKKAKIVESENTNHSEPNHIWGSNATDIPSSSSLVMTVRFVNDNIARIMRYGDYQLGNVIAFRKNTCFIRNLEGVDLIFESRDTNLYTISLDDMLKTSLICLLSKASKTKSWLLHRRLSHLNFSTLNKLAKDGLARGIPRLKFQKDHLCLECALGKSKKSSHQPKDEDTNQKQLYLLHMDFCGPMHVASINGKRYILVIVPDYSRFTWVRFLRIKDEAPEAIIKCIKNIQVRLNAIVRNVRTDNGTEFVNQTLREFYENIGI
ncbi:retrovirus-related pol polyprotein from transposon TNT 1-94 [Tanacetum coccineum]|uniref:Retrovirus-related pol polyprotein from transposon TNT 1-94 n=1 Tax=Tanacetum coccineum TaxID=301880 RepID=A0ABQ5BYL5_9ASTR